MLWGRRRRRLNGGEEHPRQRQFPPLLPLAARHAGVVPGARGRTAAASRNSRRSRGQRGVLVNLLAP
jgi:hypothetical protein